MPQKRPCKVKILDEVNCVFIGLHPDHIGYFYEEYAIFAPNHFFNPKFTMGQWDGKIRYFYSSGKTYVHLLPEILPKIIALGYKVELIDGRNNDFVIPPPIDKDYFSHVTNPETDEPWKMRPYQVDLVNVLTKNGGGVAIAGTGSGKTCCCAALAELYENESNLRSIIIVPDRNLTEQTTEEYSFFGIDVGEYSGMKKDLNHTHIVSTWQALKNNPTIIHQFHVVIVDECHGLKGNILTKLLNEYGKNIVHRFGVTGTLPKIETDAMAVKIAVGNVQINIPAHELIEQGWLAKLHIDIHQLEVNLKEEYREYLEDLPPEEKPFTYRKFKDAYFPEWTKEKHFLQTEQARLDWIVKYIEEKKDCKKGNVFCLVNGINFGKKLAKMIDGAKFVHGKDKMKARKEVYNLFKDNNGVVVIATVNIASTGLNIKRIFNMIYIDMGKSFIRVIQSIGRGLRKAPDKDFVHVSDICSDLKYSRRHLAERLKFYSEAKYPCVKTKVDYTPVDNLFNL